MAHLLRIPRTDCDKCSGSGKGKLKSKWRRERRGSLFFLSFFVCIFPSFFFTDLYDLLLLLILDLLARARASRFRPHLGAVQQPNETKGRNAKRNGTRSWNNVASVLSLRTNGKGLGAHEQEVGRFKRGSSRPRGRRRTWGPSSRGVVGQRSERVVEERDGN